MAIRKAVRIMVWGVSDGESTTFTLDLMNDPYWVGSHSPAGGGVGGELQNFSGNNTPPSGVSVMDGASSATVSGDSTIVEITVPLKPYGHKYKVTLDLFYGDATLPPPVATDPPVNVDAPHAYGPSGDTAVVGDTLTCTMGNWDNMQTEPHSYAYEWIRMTPSDFIQEDTGVTTPDYTLTAADDGFILFCYLTATNAIGSAGESSNQITVSGGTSGQTQRTKKR